ncbi:MAG: 3-deoxy-7-phosphoheptulonate synthase, partial [Pseudonocardiaceae bacterium]
AVCAAGGTAGGIHLETTPDDVTECVSAGCGLDRIGETYTTLCDPRLNPRQAVSVISAWERMTPSAPEPERRSCLA